MAHRPQRRPTRGRHGDEEDEDDEEDDEEDEEEEERPRGRQQLQRPREEDEYIGRRLPNLIDKEKRLGSNQNTDNGCPICFHNVEFYRNGILVQYGFPIPTDRKLELDKRGQDALLSEGTMDEVECVAICNEYNKIFESLNEQISVSSSMIKYEKIVPLAISIHYTKHRKTMNNVVTKDIYQIDSITDDLYGSESLVWAHLTKKTFRNKQQMKFAEQQIRIYNGLMTLKHRAIAIQAQTQMKQSNSLSDRTGPGFLV